MGIGFLPGALPDIPYLRLLASSSYVIALVRINHSRSMFVRSTYISSIYIFFHFFSHILFFFCLSVNGYRFREFGQIHKKKESALMIGRMPRDSVLSLFAAPPRIQLIRPHMNPPRKIPPPNRQSNVNPIICNI